MSGQPKTPTDRGLRPLPLTGGCPCGAIRYEIGAAPLLLYACHCTNCQRQSGGAFAMNMPVRSETFRILRGQPKAWRRLSPTGVETVSWFCADCGGRIHGSRAGRPESITVRAGGLDDTSWLVPAFHMFVRSAQPWIQLPAPDCYDTVPHGFRARAKAWQVAWGRC
ncbi:GFA family protein [Rhodopila sp.]|uniref:GFA family protein n=1 Tax=Rhodopila sp. TaxID=2480087 RepID=UPI003D09D7F6